MNKDHSKFPFLFFIAHRDAVVIVSLLGVVPPADHEDFERFKKAVLQANGRFVIFNLRDVESIDPKAYAGLAKVVSKCHPQALAIRFAGVKPSDRGELVKRGVASREEVVDNLVVALQSLQDLIVKHTEDAA